MKNRFYIISAKIWIVLLAMIGYSNFYFSFTQSRGFWNFINFLFPIKVTGFLLLLTFIQNIIIKKSNSVNSPFVDVLIIGVLPAIIIIIFASILGGTSLELQGYLFIGIASGLTYVISGNMLKVIFLYTALSVGI